MATIIAKNDPFKILQDFVDNKNIDKRYFRKHRFIQIKFTLRKI